MLVHTCTMADTRAHTEGVCNADTVNLTSFSWVSFVFISGTPGLNFLKRLARARETAIAVAVVVMVGDAHRPGGDTHHTGAATMAAGWLAICPRGSAGNRG